MHSPELFKGMLKSIILKLLYEHKKMYGYEIIQAIKELSDGRIDMAVAVIYPVLHKLTSEGTLSTEKVKVGERVRIYYSLTPEGNSTAKEKIQELAEFLNTMKKLMNSKTDLSAFSAF